MDLRRKRSSKRKGTGVEQETRRKTSCLPGVALECERAIVFIAAGILQTLLYAFDGSMLCETPDTTRALHTATK